MTTPEHKSTEEDAQSTSAASASASLAGENITFLDRLSGMSRRDAQRLVCEHGGAVSQKFCDKTTLVVLGDESDELATWLAKNKIFDSESAAKLLSTIESQQVCVVREAELWERIGLVEEEHFSRRLYTSAMLADLVSVPAAAIRRWHRRGILVAARQVCRLAYFDFTEVAVAKRLAELLKAGCSLHVIERKLKQLARQMPEVERPLAELPLVVAGKQLLIRRGEDLTEPGGQLLLDFDAPREETDVHGEAEEESPIAISIESVRNRVFNRQEEPQQIIPTTEQLLAAAIEMDNEDNLAAAVDMYRAVLVAGPTAEANFLLADALYRLGELVAARERYYAAIELDETFVEARANLGCVLAETNEPELAVAAFEGALGLQIDYTDVHYHLAGTLDTLGRSEEAEAHWRTFLNLAPDSPWADEAAARLGDG